MARLGFINERADEAMPRVFMARLQRSQELWLQTMKRGQKIVCRHGNGLSVALCERAKFLPLISICNVGTEATARRR
jgi:hypothetical protein